MPRGNKKAKACERHFPAAFRQCRAYQIGQPAPHKGVLQKGRPHVLSVVGLRRGSGHYLTKTRHPMLSLFNAAARVKIPSPPPRACDFPERIGRDVSRARAHM